MMMNFGHKRVLLYQGDTPSLFTSPEDRGTSLLFLMRAPLPRWNTAPAPPPGTLICKAMGGALTS